MSDTLRRSAACAAFSKPSVRRPSTALTGRYTPVCCGSGILSQHAAREAGRPWADPIRGRRAGRRRLSRIRHSRASSITAPSQRAPLPCDRHCGAYANPEESTAMKQLILIATISVGIGFLGLAVGRATAQDPQVRRQDLALGALAYYEDFRGPAV